MASSSWDRIGEDGSLPPDLDLGRDWFAALKFKVNVRRGGGTEERKCARAAVAAAASLMTTTAARERGVPLALSTAAPEQRNENWHH